jgi:hypothetical protein
MIPFIFRILLCCVTYPLGLALFVFVIFACAMAGEFGPGILMMIHPRAHYEFNKEWTGNVYNWFKEETK